MSIDDLHIRFPGKWTLGKMGLSGEFYIAESPDHATQENPCKLRHIVKADIGENDKPLAEAMIKQHNALRTKNSGVN